MNNYENTVEVTIKGEWFEYYRRCDNNLKRILGILNTKKFKDFYDDSTDHWQDHIIGIHNLACLSNPKEQAECRMRLREEMDYEKQI